MNTVALRRLAELNPATPEFDDTPADAHVTFLPLEAVWSDSRADHERVAVKADVANGYTRFRSGDVVCPKVTPTFQAGRAMVARTVGAGTTELHILRPRTGTDPRWIGYAVRSKHFLDEGVTAFQGVAGLQRVPPDFVNSFQVADYPPDEQRRIADFLDDRVGRIDRIITARRVVADLLDDEFQSRRSQMVRGLHMGDGHSVGGWLGEIASDWSTRRLGSISRFYSGAGFPNDYQGNELGDIPFAKVSDLALADSRLRMESAANKVSGDQLRQLGASLAPPGTIVFPKVGAALLGNTRAVLENPMTFDNNVMGVRFLELPVRYWIHLMSTIDMARISNPGPVPSVNRSAVSELQVPAADVSQQEAIGKELDEHMDETYGRVSVLSAYIELLTEYKSSLITAAVSGELDVTTAGSGIPG